MKSLALAAALLVLVVLAGCTAEDAQSWPISYRRTTCDQWLNTMSPKQQLRASADLLAAARRQRDGASDRPTDDLINQFKAGIDAGCTEPDSKLAKIGAGVYSANRDRFRP